MISDYYQQTNFDLPRQPHTKDLINFEISLKVNEDKQVQFYEIKTCSAPTLGNYLDLQWSQGQGG